MTYQYFPELTYWIQIRIWTHKKDEASVEVDLYCKERSHVLRQQYEPAFWQHRYLYPDKNRICWHLIMHSEMCCTLNKWHSLFVGLQQLAPLHLTVWHLSKGSVQRWPGSAGACVLPFPRARTAGQKTLLPEALYLLARDQWAALSSNLFVGVKVLCHVGSLRAGGSRCAPLWGAATAPWHRFQPAVSPRCSPAVIAVIFHVRSCGCCFIWM